MEPGKGTLPNLIIIGAMKCATTSLHYYLNLHPEISMSKEKELDFFIPQSNWNRGIEWYKSNFPGETKIHGESSPNYTHYPYSGNVAEKMYATAPDAKLIYILRDPIERAIAQYIHQYTEGKEERTLEDALWEMENNKYVSRSRYYIQLEQYLSYFPKSQILILAMEDLHRYRQATLQKIFRFLEVDETFYSPKFSEIKHKSAQKRRKNRIGRFLKHLSETNAAKIFSTDLRMKVGRILYLPFSAKIKRPVPDEKLRAKLADYLRDDIRRLREYSDCDFKDWSV